MTTIINSNIGDTRPIFFKSFLIHAVISHPLLWSRLIAAAETTVGLGLAAGVLPNAAAAGGMLLMLSYWMMKGAKPDLVGLDQSYFFLFLACCIAGESWFVIRRKQGAG